jgi:hypothetical protein
VKQFLAIILWVVSALVLCGCGAEKTGEGATSRPQPLFFDTTGNWQFTTTSTAGMKPLSIAGSIDQSVSEVSGTVHIDGSDCFDQLTTVGLTGKLASSKISLSSTSINGQVVTLVGNISETSFSGTFTIAGGCAGGDHGDVSGAKIASITSHLNGTLTTSGKETFTVTAQVTQGSASSNGSYGITGTATFGPTCFKSGTISSATFPSGSFILGTSVVLEIETDNGTISFHGTANQATGEIAGDYVVSNGTCSQTGTAVFVATGQWDY